MKEDRLTLVDGNQTKRNGHCCWFSLVVGLLLAAGIAVIVLSVLLHEERQKHPTAGAQAPAVVKDYGVCDDVAIIGAGPAGSYAAWRLRHRNLSISVFEFSDRPGGRLYTAQFPGIPDINMEFGGMRFLPEEHPLVNRTLHELGLKVVDFKPGVDTDPLDHVYLRGIQMTYGELGGARTPYNLQNQERFKSPKQLEWELFVNNTNVDASTDFSDGDAIYRLRTFDGVELYKQSHELVMSKIASEEAQVYLTDTLRWNRYPKAAYLAPQQPIKSHDTTTSVKPVVKTVATGYDDLPRTLLRQFASTSTRHHVRNNHELTEVLKDENGFFRLQFLATETRKAVTTPSKVAPGYRHCARSVILAVPRLALSRLKCPELESPEIRDLTQNAVTDVPVGKLYLAYRTAWWRDLVPNFRRSRSDLPLQYSYDFGTSPSTNLSVFLAGYFDLENVRLFDESNSNGEYIPGIGPDNLKVSTNTVHLATRFLSDIFNISEEDIPSPVSGAMMTWTKFPFGGGWQSFVPGYLPTQVQRRMLRPVPGDNLFIACNGFVSKDTKYFVEGAFQLIEDILKAAEGF